MSLNNIVKIIKSAQNLNVLTGAGMSTESGIPDFRSKTGIYASNPQDMLSLNNFKKDPKGFWNFIKEYTNWTNVEPNLGHKIIAKWEQDGLANNIITQNIDGLHQKAGSKNVIQIHGNMNKSTCLGCFQEFDTKFVLQQLKPYKCIHCKENFVKPDIVLFGETVDTLIPFRIAKKTDVLLVMGTSLKVFPVADIPRRIKYHGTIIIINKDNIEHNYRHQNVIQIHESISAVLNEIDKNL